MNVMRKIVLACSLMILSTLVLAQIYTWKDANGKIVYSDTPPPRKNVDKVNIKVAPAIKKSKDEAVVASETSSKSAEDLRAEYEKKVAEENKRIEAENKKRQAQNCSIAKVNLQAAEAAQNANLIKIYQKQVQTSCK